MNLKLNWRGEFLAICAYTDKIFPNHFNVELDMLAHTDNPRHQNVAFDRMKVIVNDVFAHGIFVGHENPNLPALIDIYPEKIILLPEEAYDQVIAIALFCKINAVMEKAISCVSVRISSHFGDRVQYQYETGDPMGPFAVATKSKSKKPKFAPWWNRSDLMSFDADGDIQVTSWDDLDLGWEDSEPDEEAETDAVPEEETQTKTTQVIDIKKTKKHKFHAKIVEGGKKDDN
jgi:hypothetical protein